MRRAFLTLIILATFTCQLFAKFEAQQEVAVRVDVDGGSGSGVIVTREIAPGITRSFVWTAAHVVIGLRDNEGIFKHATIFQEQREAGRIVGTSRVEAKVVAYSAPDTGHDLALLEILQDNFRPLTVSATFDLSGVIPEVGTELVHVASPRALFNSASLGIISQTDRDLMGNGILFDQTSCMGYPGSSGGGVFLVSNGQVTGLLTQGIGPGLNFIVPARRIVTFANSMKIQWAIDATAPMPSVEEREKQPVDDGMGLQVKPQEPTPGPKAELIPSSIPRAIRRIIKMLPTMFAMETETLAARYHSRLRTSNFFRRAIA